MERVADYVISRLNDIGVRHVFMVTGRGVLYLSDAIARNKNITGISTHHEQSASYAALAYAQESGGFGACLVSTGCAATNAITGALCAWQDNVPCIIISGQHKLSETTRYNNLTIRTYGSQETDIIELVKPITKYATMITDPESIAKELDKAIHMANSGRKGPVWIDIPIDIQNMRVNRENLERFKADDKTEMPLEGDIKFVLEALSNSKRPVVMIGSGVKSSNAEAELKLFIEKTSIPVVFSNSAVDVYKGENKLSIGVVASIGGTRAGNFTIQNSDLVLVLGSRLSTQVTGSEYNKFAREAKIIVVDIDPVEHSKNTVNIDKLIISDVKLLLKELLKNDISLTDVKWIDKCMHWKKVFPKCEDEYKNKDTIDLYYFADCLSNSMKSDAILLTDSGLCELIIPSTISFKYDQKCIHSVSQGAMGFALPASIGAYYSSDKEIIAVIGDGSVMMNLQELQTIKYHNLPIKIVIVNNNAYSVIRSRQKEQFRNRTIGTDSSNGIECANFLKVADCFDIDYLIIDNKNDLEDKLLELFSMKGPVICEVMCNPDQEYIHNSFALNAKKRMVRRPLEDQWPYMDRKKFLDEMIVEPIDQ